MEGEGAKKRFSPPSSSSPVSALNGSTAMEETVLLNTRKNTMPRATIRPASSPFAFLKGVDGTVLSGRRCQISPPADGPPLVGRLWDLVKAYRGRRVVDRVDLQVRRGEIVGLLGPNGAGKTTTLKLALGLGQADGGQVRLLGHPVPEQAPQARRRVGVVPQFDNLDPDFTCAENLVVYGRYFGLPREVIERRIGPLMEFAGLQGREDARLDALSGGMKRRLTMARALVNDPDVVFMDEPTTGLDPQARHLIWERLRHLRSQGKTLILTTHFMEEAERLCTRLLVMDGGRVIATGTPRELIAAHIEPQVLEVHGAEVARWAEAARPGVPRLEVVGETAFCYAQDVSALQDSLRNWPELACLHRPANLEDVFLKLTGRELRD